MYLILFLFGVVGFTAMTALGFLHGGGGHHHGTHSHGVGHGFALKGLPHGHGHAAHAGHGHTSHAHHGHNQAAAKAAPHEGDSNSMDSRMLSIWSVISPMNLFSLALGAGATGMILGHFLGASTLPWAALAGAFAFNYLLIVPIMNKLLQFASPPCEGLEGAIAKGAIAATRFDHTGRGLVKLTVDGQTVQILGTLDADEQERGISVAQGDSLTILDVDPKRNTCRVTREMAV